MFTYLNFVWLTPDFKSAVLCRAKRPFKVAGNALLSHGNNQIRLSSAITSFLRFFTIAAIYQGDIAILTDNKFQVLLKFMQKYKIREMNQAAKYR